MYFKKTLILLIFVMFIVGISYVSAEDIDNANVLSADSDLNTVSVDESLSDINEKSVSDAIDDSVTDSYESNVNSDNSDSNINENNKGTDENNGGSEEVNNEISLGSASSEILSDDLDIAIVDPSNFTTDTFNTHHDVYYLQDGIYTTPRSFYIGGKAAGYAQSNFVVRGEANSIICINGSNEVKLAFGKNCILENLKFTVVEGNPSSIIIFGNKAENVTIRNCTFENINCMNLLHASTMSNANNIKIENCSFKNCIVTNVISFLRPEKTISLSNNIFENCVGTPINVTCDIDSEVSFKVLSRNIADTGSDIQCKLEDDNGNAIYSPNLKFLVNGEEMAPTFDVGFGVYSLSYVPSGNDPVSVSASCSNTPNLTAETAYLPIVSSPNLSFEVVCSEYAYQTIYMNVTLNEAITNENVTFIIRNSKEGIVESVDKIITNGFAEATIILNASSLGDYSAYVVYNGSNQFAGASAFEDFYVYKVGIQANITPGDYSAFGLGYDIYYLSDGIYPIIKQTNIGGTSSLPISNFIIRGENNSIISFEYDPAYTSLVCGYGTNVTFENLKFTAAIDLRNPIDLAVLGFHSNSNNITIRNCTFENITNTNYIIRTYNGVVDNFVIENCSFINCNIKHVICHESSGSMSMSDCIFENCTGAPLYITNGLINEADFNCISNNVTASGSYIFGELVDSDGNVIYSPNLKFIINDEEKTPSFDRNTGLYSFWYVPTENQVSVRAVCSNVQNLNVETSYLTILASPDLSLNSTQSITYGEELIIVNATLNEAITNENVTFILKGSSGNVIKSMDALITDGFANSSFVEKLLPGTYTISVIYKGDDKFGESSASAQLTVNKISSYINVTANNVTVFDDVIVTFTMPEEVNGTLKTIRIGCFYNPNGYNNGIANRKNIAVINGTASVNFGKLAANDNFAYVYAISYDFTSSNPLYANINAHTWNSAEDRASLAQFKVLKVDTIPIIDVNDIGLGSNATIAVSGLSENATGTITYYIDDNDPVQMAIGEIYTVEGLNAGEHNVRIVYSGDSNYNGNETSASFKVHTVEFDSYEYPFDNLSISLRLPENEGNLAVTIDDSVIFNSVVSDGVGLIDLSGFSLGVHTLAISFEGNEYNITDTVDVTIIPVISSLDDLTTGDNSISIALPEDATGNLIIIIDDNDAIVVPIEDGAASYDEISGLSAGEHTITVSYEGNYPSYSSTKTVYVSKLSPSASVKVPSSITAGKSSTIYINLPSDATGVVVVDVEGKRYYAEVKNGVAAVSIAGMTAGDKQVTYSYLGDSNYESVNGSTSLKVVAPKTTDKVTVTLKKVTVTLKKVTVKKSAKKLVLKATVKVNGKAKKGLKVTFKFKGKKYTAKTNAKGLAKVIIKKAVLKKLKVGKKITYTATYGKKTAKKTVKVKK